ncbi:GTPase HflX [Gilvimarinus agarilyticus]|uniref:ribosome rescue GTPase HflX n=1 Tax=unclassified Gilvimarinus TaxID=2642066 RepID=UPI001C08B0BD|nr:MULTISPECIES: ribosome rescue GTPase HflX [unclassified Gilvimarinus]MBU2886662.1 GTPase HflX [Gilvimarinus agarilyticus]MDO6571330.1 GTPase HflX [Gilvimarinus sp. 2_MG-2023]MDO6746253.1 GTPase HflX [Gilvimarinus sp. 1_MG-2023]
MFFDRPDSGELAVLVHLDLSSGQEPEDPREFEELVLSAGGDPVAMVFGQRDTPQAKYFVGTGKLQELQALVEEHSAELVIFNHTLSPSQERNLEQALECRVLDRTGLILDIFAQRARTFEGKLQVELAQLRHMSTRLVRGWTHLERQKGGIGLRGPGETQLETDRRLLRGRISTIEKRLTKVRTQREQGRRARQRAAIPTVSLVGYTNAGKSTLFNRITGEDVYAQDQLFATLDPTMRRVELDDIGATILADTVGFISHLPHKLVEAFRATLEEAANSSLLLHVIDAAAEERMHYMEQVEEVLDEIGAGDLPQLRVFNKIDLLNMEPRIDRDDEGTPVAVWLSAQAGTGIELLFEAISELLGEEMIEGDLILAPTDGRLRAKLFEQHAVAAESFRDDGCCTLSLRIPQSDLMRILSSVSLNFDQLSWEGEAPQEYQIAQNF